MSDKLVTGSALNDILLSVKDYIDVKEFDFEDADLEEVADTEVPKLTLTEYAIKESDVNDVINKYFTTNE